MNELSKSKVLVVDDNEGNRTLLADTLENEYEVGVAVDGQDALEKVETNPPDIILLDIMMPDIDGYEVCRRLKDNQKTKEIPVLFLSVMDRMQDKTKAFKLGAVDYITKPFQILEVSSRVRTHLALQYAKRQLRDQNVILEEKVKERTKDLEKAQENLKDAYAELKSSQEKIIKQEKMASLGQLAAGVAHEINNPIGFISSNLGSLDKYISKLTAFIKLQVSVIESVTVNETIKKLEEERKKLKIDYILGDIQNLINESSDGTDRIRKIVQDLKIFASPQKEEMKESDINKCLETTLNIVWNELKYKATVKKEYGEIPLIKCYPQQISQVFMNLLVNASHAIDKTGEITITTLHKEESVFISISDTGCGISEENLNKILDPFFTTKEVGLGTGLGLSISNEIIKKHNGGIDVKSEEGKGSTFTIRIPVLGI